MQNIFNIVFTTSLYATIVGLVIVLIKGILKNRLNARWHYIIWTVLIIKLLLPFGPKSTFSIFNAVPEITYSRMYEITGQTQPSTKAYAPIDIPVSGEISSPLKADNMQRIGVLELLPYVWAFGAVTILLWFMVSYWIFYKKLQASVYASDNRVNQILKMCMNKMGIRGNITIIMQDVVCMPSLFGVIHPRILLSSKVAELSNQELEYILLHELAHYKRKDIIVNYLLLALQVVHWFNPMMWYCFKQIRQDMELAADELVLSALENTEHKAYGKTLVAILEGYTGLRLAPKLLAMADDKKGIERRLRMIMMADVFKGKKKLVIVVGVLCIALLSGILLTNGLDKKEALSDVYNKEDKVELVVSPERYTLAMSSTPGIKLDMIYKGNEDIKTVKYTTEKGTFLTWEVESGKISQEGSTAILPYGEVVYWSAMGDIVVPAQGEEVTVTVTPLDKEGIELCNKQVKIISNEGFFEVQNDVGILKATDALTQNPTSISAAVRSAILSKASSYQTGEIATEGHIILETSELEGSGDTGKLTKVYTISSIGEFGFENGIFTKISGSGAIPTVITLSSDESKGYSLVEYREPQDGGGYTKSIKEMFPYDLQDEALSSHNYYAELAKQQEQQAGEYLSSIGKTAKISAEHVEKTLANINVEASNMLFSEMGKYDSFINTCPYWLGTVQKVEDGIRYIYETSQGKTSDGYDLITFTKTKEDGTVVKQVKYKIVGSEIQKLE